MGMFKAGGLCILVIMHLGNRDFLLFTSGHSVCFFSFHWPFPEEYHWKLIKKCTIVKSAIFAFLAIILPLKIKEFYKQRLQTICYLLPVIWGKCTICTRQTIYLCNF